MHPSWYRAQTLIAFILCDFTFLQLMTIWLIYTVHYQQNRSNGNRVKYPSCLPIQNTLRQRFKHRTSPCRAKLRHRKATDTTNPSQNLSSGLCNLHRISMAPPDLNPEIPGLSFSCRRYGTHNLQRVGVWQFESPEPRDDGHWIMLAH